MATRKIDFSAVVSQLWNALLDNSNLAPIFIHFRYQVKTVSLIKLAQIFIMVAFGFRSFHGGVLISFCTFSLVSHIFVNFLGHQ